MADMNIDYIAGFLDGEGCFTIAVQNQYYHPRIGISQNTKTVLKKIQSFLAAYDMKSCLTKENHKPRRNVWYNLRINNRKGLLKLCKLLDGKLHVKDKQLIEMQKILQIESGHKTRTESKKRNIRIKESQLCRENIMKLNQYRESA